MSSIHGFCRNSDIKSLEQLLTSGNVNIDEVTTTNETALAIAVREQNLEIVRLLLEHKAKPDAIIHVGAAFADYTVLHSACFDGNKEIADLLIKAGADVNAVTENGFTPLHYAAAKGYTDIANLLLDNKANAHATDDISRTPRDMATKNKHTALASILEKAEQAQALPDGSAQPSGSKITTENRGRDISQAR